MPTVPQITAAKDLLDPQPYDETTSKLTGDSVSILHVFLRKYLHEHQMTGRYSDVASKLAAAVGIDAAQLQAVLTNVSGEGSKKAKLQGELIYLTQDTIDNELAFAILVMYEAVNNFSMGTIPSEIATAIRSHYCTGTFGCTCGCNERARTTRRC